MKNSSIDSLGLTLLLEEDYGTSFGSGITICKEEEVAEIESGSKKKRDVTVRISVCLSTPSPFKSLVREENSKKVSPSRWNQLNVASFLILSNLFDCQKLFLVWYA